MIAERIIRDVMAAKHICRRDLLKSQAHRHVKARRLTIERMREAGLSATEISVALGKNRTSIMYWLGKDWAETKRWQVMASKPGPHTETNSIVIQVCNEMRIYPAEMFGRGRDKRITNARREAMRRLEAAGFCLESIARLLKLNPSTVHYWTNPKTKAYSNRAALLRLRAKQPEEIRA